MKMLAVALLLTFLVGVAICEVDQTMALNAPPVCQKAIDLGIAIDRKTVADWKDVKEFVKTLVSQFEISDDMVHVGFILFDDKAELRLKFNDPVGNSNNLEAIDKLIDAWGPGPFGENKVIDEALQLALTDQFTYNAGARGYDEVLVLLTDGKQIPKKDQKETPAQVVARKLEAERGVKILVAGIGIADPIELWTIAGGTMEDPSKAALNVFNAMKGDTNKFDPDVAEKVAQRACQM